MNMRVVQSTIGLLLLTFFLGGSLLMIYPVDDSDAWLRHECNCRNELQGSTELDPATGLYRYIARWVRTCEVFWHWNPLPHQWSCP